MEEIILTDADNRSEIDLKQGGILKIVLEENATTGYAWEVDNQLPDQLIEVARDFKTGDQDGVGGSGKKILTYKVQKKGNGVLKLKYLQPWNGEESISKRFQISFGVK